MSREAMKLALGALKQIDEAMPFPVAKLAQAALREALAEQTALLAANKDLQNHFDALMNDYKKLSALCSSQGTRLMEYESSHEPESKPWVGLTRDERMDIINRFAGQDWVYAVEAIEAKLKEKNT